MRFLLFPFSWIYGIIIRVRNWLYDTGGAKSFKFDFPVLLVGNLSAGGTGKTPHTEYLIRLLRNNYKIATLSRGYKRKFKGFGIATELSLVEDIGDEPKLYKQKYPEVEVAVSEDRVMGVHQLLVDEPETQLVILDDGFQHRAITPSLSIVLTTYQKPFYHDYLLPAGRLREPRKGVLRADAVVITKCPEQLAEQEMRAMTEQVQHYAQRPVFFSYYRYAELKPLFTDQAMPVLNNGEAPLLVTGIAGNKQLLAHLRQTWPETKALAFNDHHFFSPADIQLIAAKTGSNKLVITTEKDAMRLMEVRDAIEANRLHIVVQPIEVVFHGNTFDQWMLNRVHSV